MGKGRCLGAVAALAFRLSISLVRKYRYAVDLNKLR